LIAISSDLSYHIIALDDFSNVNGKETNQMKIANAIVAASLVLGVSAGLVACKSTHESGVTSDIRTQWTDVNADTKTTTNAAKAVLKADALLKVKAESTDVDGKATAEKADGTKVTVLIKKVDAGSQVSVTVGTFGDSTQGADWAARIKAKAEGR
jgi:hypothetical protein